jgi:hypothetical protein
MRGGCVRNAGRDLTRWLPVQQRCLRGCSLLPLCFTCSPPCCWGSPFRRGQQLPTHRRLQGQLHVQQQRGDLGGGEPLGAAGLSDLLPGMGRGSVQAGQPEQALVLGRLASATPALDGPHGSPGWQARLTKLPDALGTPLPVQVGRERVYTPGPDDVGAILKFECTAYDAGEQRSSRWARCAGGRACCSPFYAVVGSERLPALSQRA